MRKIFFLWLIVIVSSLFVWFPFWSSGKMDKVFANYDGPNYIIISKCWYNKECIAENFSMPLPLEYYPAHFPGYPFLISLLNNVMPGWWAMITVNLLSTGLMATFVYLLLNLLKIKPAFWLSTILLFLPARMLILHAVGAPETMFIVSLLASIYFFKKEKYLVSGIALAVAQTIKTPAILLFIAYVLYVVEHDNFQFKKWLKKWPLILGPITVLLIFLFFKQQTRDFLAYLHSGDNFHLVFPPFQTFISSRSWLGDFWLEDIIYIYLIGGLAVVHLIKKYKYDIIALFPLIFYITTLFIAHRDLSRYSAPLYPFWLIAFSDFLKRKEFKIIFLIILPAIYLYTINFINYNVAPIADWTPYK